MMIVSVTHRPRTIDAIVGLTLLIVGLVLAGWFLWFLPPYFLLADPRVSLDSDLLLYMLVRFYEPIVIISALVIAVNTLKDRIWTRKANIMFQTITIAIFLIGSIQFALNPGSGDSIIREDFIKNLSLAASLITLYLLFRPEVKEQYKRLLKASPS